MKTYLPTIRRTHGRPSIFDQFFGDTWDSFFYEAPRLVEEECGFERVTKKEASTEIKLDMPGFSKDQIDIEISDTFLQVKAETEGRHSFSYSRSLRGYESDKASAKLENGVLTIDLPLKERLEPKAKRLEIQ